MDTTEYTEQEEAFDTLVKAHLLCEKLLERKLPEYLRLELREVYKQTLRWVELNTLH